MADLPLWADMLMALAVLSAAVWSVGAAAITVAERLPRRKP